MKLGVFAVCLFIIIATWAHLARADDCTHDGEYSKFTCYGIQHGAIAAVVVGAMTAADRQLALPVAIGTCGVFVLKELDGQGGLFDSADRAFDWITPCAVGGFIAYKWGDQSWVPFFGGGHAGIAYRTRFE